MPIVICIYVTTNIHILISYFLKCDFFVKLLLFIYIGRYKTHQFRLLRKTCALNIVIGLNTNKTN